MLAEQAVRHNKRLKFNLNGTCFKVAIEDHGHVAGKKESRLFAAKKY